MSARDELKAMVERHMAEQKNLRERQQSEVKPVRARVAQEDLASAGVKIGDTVKVINSYYRREIGTTGILDNLMVSTISTEAIIKILKKDGTAGLRTWRGDIKNLAPLAVTPQESTLPTGRTSTLPTADKEKK